MTEPCTDVWCYSGFVAMMELLEPIRWFDVIIASVDLLMVAWFLFCCCCDNLNEQLYQYFNYLKQDPDPELPLELPPLPGDFVPGINQLPPFIRPDMDFLNVRPLQIDGHKTFADGGADDVPPVGMLTLQPEQSLPPNLPKFKLKMPPLRPTGEGPNSMPPVWSIKLTPIDQIDPGLPMLVVQEQQGDKPGLVCAPYACVPMHSCPLSPQRPLSALSQAIVLEPSNQIPPGLPTLLPDFPSGGGNPALPPGLAIPLLPPSGSGGEHQAPLPTSPLCSNDRLLWQMPAGMPSILVAIPPGGNAAPLIDLGQIDPQKPRLLVKQVCHSP